MNTPGLEFDWEANRANLMRCVFQPRTEYNGRPMKAGLSDHIGREFQLEILWQMDENDSYPGEFALSTPGTCGALIDTLDIAWIASGDVVVLDVIDDDNTVNTEC